MRDSGPNIDGFQGRVLSDNPPDSVEDLFVIAPTTHLVRSVVRSASDTPAYPSTRILAAPDVVETALKDFVTELYYSDAVSTDTITIATSTDGPVADPTGFPPLLVANGTVQAAVAAPAATAPWTITEQHDPTATAIREQFTPAFEAAHTVDPEVPTRASFFGTAADLLSDRYSEDLKRLVDTADHIGGPDDLLDIGLVAVALGARHQLQNQQLCQFGEDTGIHSSASINRRKRRLEDAGIITHDAVSAGLGRPSHQLRVDDDELARTALDRFLAVLRDRLNAA